MAERTNSLPAAGRASSVPGYENIPLTLAAAGIFFFLGIYALGPIVTLAAVLCFGVIVASRWRSAFSIVSATWLFLLFPAWAVYSAAWSDLPSTSLYYGLQLLLTAAMGLFIAYTVPLGRISIALWLGTLAGVLLGLAWGGTGPSAEGAVLIGLTGSKNQIAYYSLFFLLSSLAVAAGGSRSWLVRLLALAGTVPAIYLIWQANATTALISTLASVALFGALLISRFFPSGVRLFGLVSAGLAALAFTAAAPELERAADRFREDVLGKDQTLTGRTILWQYADDGIEERPVLGHGYNGFWFGEQGAGLLQRFDQDDPRGYNFHDTFRQITVDLGYIGLALFVAALGAALVKLLLLLVSRPDLNLYLVGTILFAVVMRMKVELVIAPMLFDTVMLWLGFGYIWRTQVGRLHSGATDIKLRRPDLAGPTRAARPF